MTSYPNMFCRVCLMASNIFRCIIAFSVAAWFKVKFPSTIKPASFETATKCAVLRLVMSAFCGMLCWSEVRSAGQSVHLKRSILAAAPAAYFNHTLSMEIRLHCQLLVSTAR